MTNAKFVVLTLIAVAIGCAAQPFIVPAAKAGTAGGWDYFCFATDNAEELEPKAKAAGREGWEMVGMGPDRQGGDQVTCFKRPL
jgi:hypothetical protein